MTNATRGGGRVERRGDKVVVRIVGALAVIACAGLLLLSLVLLGAPIPGAPRFPGPGGPLAFLVIGTVYGALAALFTVAAFGVLTRRGWAWSVAIGANAAALLLTLSRPVAAGHLTPDVIPLLTLTGIALIVLVSGRGRAAVRGPASRREG